VTNIRRIECVRAVRTEDHKLIIDEYWDDCYLFAVSMDPYDTKNLYGELETVQSLLHDRLKPFVRADEYVDHIAEIDATDRTQMEEYLADFGYR